MVISVCYYMLLEKENALYLTLLNEKKEIIDDFFSLESNQINDYIKTIKTKNTFFINWDKEEVEENNIKIDINLLLFLFDTSKFVNNKFKKITKKSINEISLIAKNYKENKINMYIEINDDTIFKKHIIANYLYSNLNNIFYEIDIQKNDLFSTEELFEDIDKYELESYYSLVLKNYKNINFRYEDFETVIAETKEAIPQIIIEKISFDNSLYIKFDSIISTMDYSFLKKNDLEKIVVINEMEKKIEISNLNLENSKSNLESIIKILNKLQKKIGLKSSFYLDNENFIILQEKLAKEFVKEKLLQLMSKYNVIGTDKLKKYNIKTVNPKIFGNFNYNLDYLEGEVEIDIEGEKFKIQELFNKYKKDEYIILSDGTNAIINKEYIKKLKRIFKEDNNNIKISFFDIPLAKEILENDIWNDLYISKNKIFFEGFNNINFEDKNLPELNATLRNYQKYGYNWLKYITDNNLGACLADDMGLGKTLQAIALITNIYINNCKSLVVMPKTLIYNWENEIKKFSPSLKPDIYYGFNRDFKKIKSSKLILTTYGTIRNDIEKFIKLKFDLIVLDEAQNIKNINSQTTKSILLLKSNKRVALSGTPIENNIFELYSLFRFLNPSMFGDIKEFQNSYVYPIQNFMDKSIIEELRKKIYPFLLRRIKKEVLKDLPDKIEKVLYINMNNEHRKIYEEKRKYFYSLLENNKNKNGEFNSFFIIQAINELRHIISSPEYIDKKIFSEKKEILIESVIEAIENNHKVLIFANYLSSMDTICDSLTAHGIKYLKMTGQTKDRQKLVDKFQNDNRYKVFVMTLKTGGLGLNLVAADTIFVYDPWWNKTVENQAIDRAYRLGQDKTVFAYKMIMKDTIEEKILKLQELKSKLVDDLISEDNLYTKKLSKDDIEFILGNKG